MPLHRSHDHNLAFKIVFKWEVYTDKVSQETMSLSRLVPMPHYEALDGCGPGFHNNGFSNDLSQYGSSIEDFGKYASRISSVIRESFTYRTVIGR
jgi:hypothetical protein